MSNRVKYAASIAAGAVVGAGMAYLVFLRRFARGMDAAFGY